MVSIEWVSSVASESPSLAVVPESPSSLVFEVWLDALVFMDDEPPESLVGDGLDPLSVRVIGECIGKAVDGFRSSRSASGLGSSLVAALLLEVMLVQQIATMSTPVSQAVNSVSSTVAIFRASPLCSDWEDSFLGAADSVYSLVTEETKIDSIPSPAKGLIRRWFFGSRVVSLSSSVVKEASLLS
jgi:hypothetical protein